MFLTLSLPTAFRRGARGETGFAPWDDADTGLKAVDIPENLLNFQGELSNTLVPVATAVPTIDALEFTQTGVSASGQNGNALQAMVNGLGNFVQRASTTLVMPLVSGVVATTALLPSSGRSVGFSPRVLPSLPMTLAFVAQRSVEAVSVTATKTSTASMDGVLNTPKPSNKNQKGPAPTSIKTGSGPTAIPIPTPIPTRAAAKVPLKEAPTPVPVLVPAPVPKQAKAPTPPIKKYYA